MEKMGTRAVLVNHNQWFEYHNVWNDVTQQREEGWDVNTSYLPVDAKIPGMPSVVDGKYYTVQGIFDNFDALINSGYKSVNPIGDVTDEEIVYVSNWFRSNDQIQSDVPQFTEFFIQDVSQDKDRKSYPDGEWIDCNLPVHLPEGGLDNGTDHITFGMDYFYVNTSENKTEHTNNYNKERANWIPESNPSSYEQTFPIVLSSIGKPKVDIQQILYFIILTTIQIMTILCLSTLYSILNSLMALSTIMMVTISHLIISMRRLLLKENGQKLNLTVAIATGLLNFLQLTLNGTTQRSNMLALSVA